ncbi:MAG: HIT domain-containing protein, partial [Puniceicoccales bacterium]
MPYIEAPRTEKERGNPFTRMASDTDDAANHVVWRGQHCYVVMNKFPYNAGHLLVAPYREVGELSGLTAEERADLMEGIIVGQQILTDAIQPDGFNVGFNFGSAAGAGI